MKFLLALIMGLSLALSATAEKSKGGEQALKRKRAARIV